LLNVFIFIGDLGSLGSESLVPVNHIHLQGERKVIVLIVLIAFDHDRRFLSVDNIDRVDCLRLVRNPFYNLGRHDGDSLDFTDVVGGLGYERLGVFTGLLYSRRRFLYWAFSSVVPYFEGRGLSTGAVLLLTFLLDKQGRVSITVLRF
jgi:hypothetical protein